MTRAVWKKPFAKKNLFKSLFFNQINKKSETMLIRSRDCVIFPSFIGCTFSVYDGRKFAYVHVFDTMIGHKFGEFVTTRKRVAHKKKTK